MYPNGLLTELDELRLSIDFGGLLFVGRTVGDFGGLLVKTSSIGLENVVVFVVAMLELYVGVVVVTLVITGEYV